MARPIPLELPPRDPREELRKRLDRRQLNTPRHCSILTSYSESCMNMACLNCCAEHWEQATS
jgi:hypothetical protein